jgi:hypothetical protein
MTGNVRNNVEEGHDCATIVAVEKQQLLHIPKVFL